MQAIAVGQEEVQERNIDPLVAPVVQELDGIVQCFQLGTQGGVVRGHIYSYLLGLAHGRRATDTLQGEWRTRPASPSDCSLAHWSRSGGMVTWVSSYFLGTGPCILSWQV
jgi:hypothetical protein